MSRNLARAKSARRARNPSDALTKPKGRWHHGDLRSSLIAWGTHILDTEGTGAMSMRAADSAAALGSIRGAPTCLGADLVDLEAVVDFPGLEGEAATMEVVGTAHKARRGKRTSESSPWPTSRAIRSL